MNQSYKVDLISRRFGCATLQAIRTHNIKGFSAFITQNVFAMSWHLQCLFPHKKIRLQEQPLDLRGKEYISYYFPPDSGIIGLCFPREKEAKNTILSAVFSRRKNSEKQMSLQNVNPFKLLRMISFKTFNPLETIFSSNVKKNLGIFQ